MSDEVKKNRGYAVKHNYDTASICIRILRDFLKFTVEYCFFSENNCIFIA